MSADPAMETGTPRAEAAAWLALSRSSEMSAHDKRAFQVWLEQDVAHRVAFEEMERHWRAFGEMADDAEIMTLIEVRSRQFDRPARYRQLVGIAAILAVVGAFVWQNAGAFDWRDLFSPRPNHTQEFRTSIGQRTTLGLPDGTVVTLDTDSVLRAEAFKGERRVSLEKGRAYFKVAPDRRRPFIVSADGKTVTALGTAFDVRVDRPGLEVTLAQGRVRVEEPKSEGHDAQKADLRAGWRLLASNDSEKWRLAQVDLSKETSWLSGRLNFFNDPLGEAAGEMNRYSEKKIVIRDAVLAQKPIVGVFRAGDVDDFIKAVRMYGLAKIAVETDDFVELEAP